MGNSLELDNKQLEKKTSYFPILLLHLAIMEILVISGADYIVYTYLRGYSVALIVYILTCLLYCLNNKVVIIKIRNIRRLLFIIIWIISVTFVFGQGNHNLRFLSYILSAFGTFLLASSANFNTFKELLLKYLIILSIVSIIVHLGHSYFGLFPSKTFVYPSGETRNYSFIFNTEVEEGRLASIYWEPGQYQIIILYVLGLFADEWSDLNKWKRNIKKFGILIIAMLMTLSTTAYLMLMLIVLIVLVRSGFKHARLLPFYLGLSVSAFLFLFNSYAVQNKVEQSETVSEGGSYAIRLADNIGCLLVTLDDPLTGYGTGSDVLTKRLYSEGSLTSSNGWLYGSAQLGIPFIIFLWYYMWKNVKRINLQANTFLLFAVLVLSQCNEADISFPYIYMYIFYFPQFRSVTI